MVKNKKSFKICKRCNKEFFTIKEDNEFCKRCKIYFANKNIHKFKKENHLCYDCGKKVKPITYYPSRCSCCATKKNNR